MTNSGFIWLLIALAFVGANLPFVNQRLMAVLPLPGGGVKSLGWRVLELVLWYFIVGGMGLVIEKSLGRIYPQGWEFYAVSGALFLTLAFPGFVYRYLLRRKA
ncbi:MAG: DUF2818 family protein [Pseudomonadota bacterium]|nr:DUF2818 family protein [Pseudomonadota bacterium]